MAAYLCICDNHRVQVEATIHPHNHPFFICHEGGRINIMIGQFWTRMHEGCGQGVMGKRMAKPNRRWPLKVHGSRKHVV